MSGGLLKILLVDDKTDSVMAEPEAVEVVRAAQLLEVRDVREGRGDPQQRSDDRDLCLPTGRLPRWKDVQRQQRQLRRQRSLHPKSLPEWGDLLLWPGPHSGVRQLIYLHLSIRVDRHELRS